MTTTATDMVVLEQVLSGDPAQDCALKVQQLPLDQQYAAHSTCVMLSRPSASQSPSRQDEGGAAALIVMAAIFLAVVIYIVTQLTGDPKR